MLAVDSLSRFVVWGIPHRCTADAHVELLERCLKSIRDIYHWHHIVVVDSDSPKKDHLPGLCKRYRAEVANVVNKNYECGAWKIVYEQYRADFYCFVHDSCWLVRPLGDTLEQEISAYRCVPNSPTDWYGASSSHKREVLRSLRGTKWDPAPDNFWTLVGQIMFVKCRVMDLLYDNKFFDLLPTNKHGAQSWERRLGACLSLEGFDEQLAENQIGCWKHGKPYNHKMAKSWVMRE